jgi:hypothetical protein
MSIHHENLDAAVRGFMVRELERDQGNGNLYISPRLTDSGAQAWPHTLREAMERHEDEWLASTLRERHYVKAEEHLNDWKDRHELYQTIHYDVSHVQKNIDRVLGGDEPLKLEKPKFEPLALPLK